MNNDRITRPLLAALLCVAGGAANAGVVISQAYGGGGNTGAPFNADFVELFNNGTSTESIAGWSIQYASSTGSSWTKPKYRQRQHSRAADAAEEIGAVLIHGTETGKAGRSGRLTSTRTARNHP